MSYLEALETAALEDKLAILKKKWSELIKLYPSIKKEYR